MKKRLFYLLFAIGFSCNAQDNKGIKQQLNDTTRKILDISIVGNALTKGLSDISIFDIVDDTLYLINRDSFLQINIKSGSISSNEKINSFLNKQLKEKKYASKLVSKKNHFYLSFFNELYDVSKVGDAKKIYSNSYSINDFSVNNNILIASRDTIKIISSKGTLNSSLSFDFTDAGYIKASQGICYSATSEDNIYEFYSPESSNIKVKTFASLALNKEMEEPFVSYASEDFFIAFDYWKRNTVYILKKGAKKNEVVKTISLKSLNYAPSHVEIQKEEGQPNFKIGYSNGTYYAIALAKGKLKIFPFTFNE